MIIQLSAVFTAILVIVAILIWFFKWRNQTNFSNAIIQQDEKKEPGPAPSGPNWLLLNALWFSFALVLFGIGGRLPSWQIWLEVNLTSTALVLWFFQGLYTMMSFQIVNSNQLAILLYLGKYIRDVSPGLVYVPWRICRLITITKNMMERDLPASPDKIFHGDLSEVGGVAPPGKVPAIRATFLAAQGDNDMNIQIGITRPGGVIESKTIIVPKDDAFNIRGTSEVEVSYGFKVTDLRTFWETIGSVENAMSSMDDHTIGGFVSRLQQVTQAEAMIRLKEIAQEVKDELCAFSKDWGIDVGFAKIKPFGNSHDLNKSVTGVATAREAKKASFHKTDGEEYDLTRKGVGIANQEADLLSARAQGLADMAEVASNPAGQFAMGVQATERSYEAAKAVIVPNNNLYGLIPGLTEAMGNLSVGKTPTDNTAQSNNPQGGTQPSAQPPKPQQPKPPKIRRFGGEKKDKK